MNRTARICFALTIHCFAFTGCTKQSNAGPSAAKKAASVTAAPDRIETSKPANAAKNKVARIIFLGKKDACECTKGRIEKSWQVLHKVLNGRRISVERYQIDVHEAEAKRYHAIRPYMVIPAMYFFDAEEKLLDLLQGEVTEIQLLNLPW